MSMTLDKKRTEAYVSQIYFELYNRMERCIKDIFSNYFNNEMSLILRKRLIYYAGWLFSDIRMVDFDTYSLKREIQKYDEKTVLSRMTLKQIMKFCEKESDYTRFDFSIPSINKKMENISFFTCCSKWIDMRNKLAHLYEGLDFSKNVIEVLNNSELKKYCIGFLDESEIESLSENGIYILSNYIYLQKANKIIQRIGDNHEEEYK